MLIKPGKLIDIGELSPLTLQDRRVYNLLLLNAWDNITEPKEHCINKRDLRGSQNVNARVADSLLQLMGTVAQLRIRRDADVERCLGALAGDIGCRVIGGRIRSGAVQGS